MPEKINLYYDQNKIQKIDVEDDSLKVYSQQILEVVYKISDFDYTRLLNWLDKRLVLHHYSQQEKREYLRRAIDYAKKEYTLNEISINCYAFRDILKSHIESTEQNISIKNFVHSESRFIMDSIFYETPKNITLYNPYKEPFKKHMYESADFMNGEEL